VTERFYGELAALWPQISAPEEYAEEAAVFAEILGDAREVLELGSGGGNNASHLKAGRSMTLVDISERMLEVSRELNPECAHAQGDMRTIRLGREFDAVFVHDAIDYMTTEDDLRAAIETAYVHCRPGGLALFVPDETTETFEPGADHGGHGDIRYLEWSWDPDPADSWTLTEYAFLVREGDAVRAVHETHRFGLFPRATWLRLLREAGFEPSARPDRVDEARTVFVAVRASG
jgi:SAM-dependent methyltransferase